MGENNYEIRYVDGEGAYYPLARVESLDEAQRIAAAWLPVKIESQRILINETIEVPDEGEVVWWVTGRKVETADQFYEDVDGYDEHMLRGVGRLSHSGHTTHGLMYARDAQHVRELVGNQRASLNLPPIELEWIGDD